MTRSDKTYPLPYDPKAQQPVVAEPLGESLSRNSDVLRRPPRSITVQRAALATLMVIGLGLMASLAFGPRSGTPRLHTLPLNRFPGITPTLLVDLKKYFPTISDPVAYDSQSGTADMSLQDYPEPGDKLTFLADIQTLEQLVHERKYIESRGYGARTADMAEGISRGVAGLVSGLWALVRHPVQSAKGMIGAIAAAVSTSPADVMATAREMAEAFYMARCIEEADAHGIPYGMTLLPSTTDCVHGAVNGQLSGEASFEVAMLLAPVLAAGKAKHASTIAKVANVSDDVGRMSRAGQLPAEAASFAKQAGRFSQAAAIFERNLTRLSARVRPKLIKAPLAAVPLSTRTLVGVVPFRNTIEKGSIGDRISHKVFGAMRYTHHKSKFKGTKGIDGVYTHIDTTGDTHLYIVENKIKGAVLRTGQMTEPWIATKCEEMLKYGDSAVRRTAKLIREARESGSSVQIHPLLVEHDLETGILECFAVSVDGRKSGRIWRRSYESTTREALEEYRQKLARAEYYVDDIAEGLVPAEVP